MTQVEAIRLIVFLGLIGYLLARHLPAAILWVRPSLTRVRTEGGPERVEPSEHGRAIAEMLVSVQELGFAPLGLKWERRPFGRRQKEFVFAHTAERSFAAVMPVSNEAWLYFFTPFRDGAVVITADFRWSSTEEPDFLVGGLPAATPVEVWNAHRRRVSRFVEAGRPLLEGELDLAARERTTVAYYASGPGRRETRRRELRGVIFSAITLAFLGAVVLNLIQRYLHGAIP